MSRAREVEAQCELCRRFRVTFEFTERPTIATIWRAAQSHGFAWRKVEGPAGPVEKLVCRTCASALDRVS